MIKNGYKICPNLWDTMKMDLRDKFRALRNYIKKLKRPHVSNLIAELKSLEQKEEIIHKIVDSKKKIQLSNEIIKLKQRKIYEQLNREMLL